MVDQLKVSIENSQKYEEYCSLLIMTASSYDNTHIPRLSSSGKITMVTGEYLNMKSTIMITIHGKIIIRENPLMSKIVLMRFKYILLTLICYTLQKHLLRIMISEPFPIVHI